MTTTEYIYKNLFQEQRQSDVCIKALGKEWHLHKLYLSQSPYFHAMFSGGWKESHENLIEIEILDERITTQMLDEVFGSMYLGEIKLDDNNVLPMLATATLFHMESIIARCAEVMLENLNYGTALDYYEAACEYAVMNVKDSTFKWFELNLLYIFSKRTDLLSQISIDLMCDLTASLQICVIQSEYSVYVLLRNWMALQLHPDFESEDHAALDVVPDVQEPIELAPLQTLNEDDVSELIDFSNREGECSFLSTAEGEPYVRVFQKLRLQYLANDCVELKRIFDDNIIPWEWLCDHLETHWDALERPRKEFSDQEFLEQCMRFGFQLIHPANQSWHWKGVNYDLDLMLGLTRKELYIRQHELDLEHRVGEQSKRSLTVRVTITSVDEQRHPILTQCSGIVKLSLASNEEVLLLELNPRLVYPLIISFNIIVDMPPNLLFKEIMPENEEHPLAPPVDPAAVRRNSMMNPLRAVLAILRDYLWYVTDNK